MNKLQIGFSKDFQNDFSEFRKHGFLLIADEVPHIPKGRTFDLTLHSFNPLKDITEKRARELADALYAMTPGGENTLTVRNGRIALQEAFMQSDRLDRLETKDEEAQRMVKDILFNPIVRRVLCNPTNFSLKPSSVVLLPLNRAELGRKDALILGLIFMNAFQGQLIVPDFGFYGRDAHIALIEQDRLIAGVNFLDELPKQLRQAALLIKDKIPLHATFDDAELLAKYEGLRPDPLREANTYDDFIREAIA